MFFRSEKLFQNINVLIFQIVIISRKMSKKINQRHIQTYIHTGLIFYIFGDITCKHK